MGQTSLTPANWLATFYDKLDIRVIERDRSFDVVLLLDSEQDEDAAHGLANGIRVQLDKLRPQLKAVLDE